MNEQEKSIKLAELMGWERKPNPYSNGAYADEDYVWDVDVRLINGVYPYASHEFGLAQFAAILLKFPEVMIRFMWGGEHGKYFINPTQSNILDEILRMNGVEI